MLRKIRIAVSVVLLTLITFFFIDFAGLTPQNGFLTRIQFVPALLALNITVLLCLFAVTFLFGRVYCSFICPLGIWQDVVNWFAGRVNRRKKYKFRKAKTILRYSMLAAVIVAFLSGMTFLLGLLDPYSMYARISVNVFKPVYLEANNLIAALLEKFDNYTLYYVDVAVRSVLSFCVAVVSLLVVSWLSFKYGRLYCNTICPVGTFLGVISKYSLFKIRIDENKCNSCGLCATKCKASCINSKEHQIDYSRCVDCFDCLDACKQKALSYTYVTASKTLKESNEGRRNFLTVAGASLFVSPLTKAKEVTAKFEGGKPYTKNHPLSPPGSISADHLLKHCTACHLCVSRCPSHVLTPALFEYGLGGIMQPRMSFEKGFCNFDCTICSEMCPNGAILPLTKEEKHLTQVGRVVFVKENCIVYKDDTSCGACSEHCPTQAVSMVPYRGGLTIPHINPDICVGCGGCEYVCPARPYRAIYIEGNEVHQQAVPFKESEKHDEAPDDFGF